MKNVRELETYGAILIWCVYLAGMEYDYQMEKRRYRNKR